jgi:methionyl aminopeptidase
VSITSPQELEGLQAAGAVVRRVLEALKSCVPPGITTGELDAVGALVMREQGVHSAPAMVYGFPANLISVNDEAVHGIPGDRILEDGDLVKLDVTVEKDGVMADAAETVLWATPRTKRLV